MSTAQKERRDDVANLPLFSLPAYRQLPVRVLLIKAAGVDIAWFRGTLQAISGETFDLLTVDDETTGLGLIGSGRFDIAFVDQLVGDNNGMEIIRRAGGRLCPTPMVLLSGGMDTADEQRCLKEGAVDVLDRIDMSPSLLRRVIRYARFNHDTTRRLVVNEERYRKLARNASEESGEKSKFLAHMSHELRTPLNAIIGFSEAMGHELFGELAGPGADKYREYIEHINSSGNHLLSLINDLLDLSKIEAGKFDVSPDVVRLADIFDDVSHMTLPQAEEASVSIAVEMENRALEVFADRRLITQAILNIVANAVKFSPQGGSVVLKAGCEGRSVVLSVADQGCGISKEELRHVLEPFHQVGDLERRPERGTGLGLPLARSILELHQGGLEIESEPGQGTTVSIWLPKNVRRLDVGATEHDQVDA